MMDLPWTGNSKQMAMARRIISHASQVAMWNLNFWMNNPYWPFCFPIKIPNSMQIIQYLDSMCPALDPQKVSERAKKKKLRTHKTKKHHINKNNYLLNETKSHLWNFKNSFHINETWLLTIWNNSNNSSSDRVYSMTSSEVFPTITPELWNK